MDAGTLSSSGVHAYLRHIPKRGIEEGWPEEIYALTDPCLRKLYEYSKAKGFIPDDYTYDDFLTKRWDLESASIFP